MTVRPPSSFAAVDLGASSGRVMVGRTGPGQLVLDEAHRFPNRPIQAGGTLHWDILALFQGVLDGLRAAGRRTGGALDGVGVDSWGVDYGLLDADGALLGNPVSYRDGRTENTVQAVFERCPQERLYALTGIQHLPFNTVFQVVAASRTAQWRSAARLLLIPDLIGYWLTGVAGTELTNASTTSLIDPRTGRWCEPLTRTLGIDLDLFPALRSPGSPAGELLPAVLSETALAGPVPVTAVGSHDTASAVVAVPADGERFAFVSCGTWSLAGMELSGPVLTEDSRRANFTNELGVDGTVRFLRNIMGLWLLQECLREWSHPDLGELLETAARATPLRSVVDVADPVFLPPGDMPGRIVRVCRAAGEPPPRDRAELVRCVLDSLALAHRGAVIDAQRLSGRAADVVHLVGGGSRNTLLCQLTADACGLPVVAGPAEAAALGNIVVQARSAGVLKGALPDLRALLRGTQPLRRFTPAGDPTPWERAARRIVSPGRHIPTRQEA